MSSKDKVKSSKSKEQLPSTSTKDPLPVSLPTTSKDPGPVKDTLQPDPPKKPWMTRCWNYMYDKEHKLYCGRSCKSWWYMLIYSIMYFIFLSTYTMIFLYATLQIIKMTEVYNDVDKSELMAFTDNGIGLTAVPTSLHSFPYISYTFGQDDYGKYVKALDALLLKRRKREITNLTDLGPCGLAPYGYGEEPCLIIRINKQKNWSAKPFKANLTEDLPVDLRGWLKLEKQKLWLHCDGYHLYDNDHLGKIKYYPYPPGFDPGIFPLDMAKEAPLIAIQISNFTLGLSLAVECKLWYEGGVSSVAFLLYVEPKSRSVRNDKV